MFKIGGEYKKKLFLNARKHRFSMFRFTKKSNFDMYAHVLNNVKIFDFKFEQ